MLVQKTNRYYEDLTKDYVPLCLASSICQRSTTVFSHSLGRGSISLTAGPKVSLSNSRCEDALKKFMLLISLCLGVFSVLRVIVHRVICFTVSNRSKALAWVGNTQDHTKELSSALFHASSFLRPQSLSITAPKITFYYRRTTPVSRISWPAPVLCLLPIL